MDAEYILSNINFVGEEWKFVMPFGLMVIDFLTGVIHAWATGHLKSYKMREGLMKKFAEISILVIGVLFEYGLELPSYVLSGFSIYIMFMELVSICENLKKMGIPIPKFIEKAFSSTNDNIIKGELTKEEIEQLLSALNKSKKD